MAAACASAWSLSFSLGSLFLSSRYEQCGHQWKVKITFFLTFHLIPILSPVTFPGAYAQFEKNTMSWIEKWLKLGGSHDLGQKKCLQKLRVIAAKGRGLRVKDDSCLQMSEREPETNQRSSVLSSTMFPFDEYKNLIYSGYYQALICIMENIVFHFLTLNITTSTCVFSNHFHCWHPLHSGDCDTPFWLVSFPVCWILLF